MNSEQKKNFYVALIVLGVAILACIITQYVTVTIFNSRVYVRQGYVKTDETNISINFRSEKTSTWKKRNLGLYGTTCDALMHNHSKYEVDRWNLRINIMGDCYLNQFWNGEVEIHQYVGTDKQVVQRLDLSDYSYSDLNVEYSVDNSDLLIPLKKGDYLIYFPSENNYEMPIDPGEDVIVGMIFYYADNIDLSNFELSYNYYKSYTNGGWFYASLAFIVFWFMVFLSYYVYTFSYRKAEREMEAKKSGLSCISDLYDAVYIINIPEDTVVPVGIKEENDKKRPKDLGAAEQFMNLFTVDPVESYRGIMQEFGDLHTLRERLKNRENVAAEYISSTHGWSRVRFIVMERGESGVVDSVLFTLQNINDDRKELEEIMKKVELAESEIRAKSTFLANMANEIRLPINNILENNSLILDEIKEGSAHISAVKVNNSGKLLLSLINSIIDYSDIEAGRFSLVEENYSLSQMISEIYEITKAELDKQELEFEIDVTESLPDRLYGDGERIKRIIINLLMNSFNYTRKGTVKLSIYGKSTDEATEHLLISVRNTGECSDDKKQNSKSGVGIKLVNSLLKYMDSELQITGVYGDGSDNYFELNQIISGEKAIGKVIQTGNSISFKEE